MLAAAVIGFSSMARAEEPDESAVKTPDKPRYVVPADWPIEKRAGTVGPIPVEEYLALKFKKTDERFYETNSVFESKIGEVRSRLDALEKDVTAIKKRLDELNQ